MTHVIVLANEPRRSTVIVSVLILLLAGMASSGTVSSNASVSMGSIVLLSSEAGGQGIDWRPDDSYALIVRNSANKWTFDGQTFNPILSSLDMNVADIAWRPQGDYALIVGSHTSEWRSKVAKWDAGASSFSEVYSNYLEIINGVAWSSDGSYAYLVGTGGLVLKFTHSTQSLTHIILGIPDLGDVEFRPGTNTAYFVGTYDIGYQPQSNIFTYDGSTLGHLYISGSVYNMAITWKSDGTRALITTNSGSIYLYDLSTFTLVSEGNGYLTRDVEYQPGTSLAIGARDDGYVLEYDGTSGNMYASPSGAYALQGVSWRSSGDYALTSGSYWTAKYIPPGSMAVSVSLANTLIASNENTTASIRVLTGGQGIAGATVTVSVDPTGPTLMPNSGQSDANGFFNCTITASPVLVETGYQVTATAEKSGYMTQSGYAAFSTRPYVQTSVTLSACEIYQGENCTVQVNASVFGVGTPLENARVDMDPIGSGKYDSSNGFTDASGRFITTFRSYPSHNYGTWAIMARTSMTGFFGGIGFHLINISIPPLQIPAPLSPANHSTQTEIPDLDWTIIPGASYYDVLVSNEPSVEEFHLGTYGAYGISAPPYEVHYPYAYGHTYYWKVRAGNSTDHSEWSEIWSFTTNVNAIYAYMITEPASTISGQIVETRVNVTSDGFHGVSGATVQLSSDGGGTFGAVVDAGNGNYTAPYTVPDTYFPITDTLKAYVTKVGYQPASYSYRLSVLPPYNPPLVVVVGAYPDSISESSTSRIIVNVTYDTVNPVYFASITLSSTFGGSFSPVTYYGDCYYDSYFTPPDVSTDTTITITATASKPESGRPEGTGQTTLRVIHSEDKSMEVSVSAVPLTVAPGGTTDLTITVGDGGQAVVGSSVALSSSGGGSFTPSSGTTGSAGTMTSRFTAPQVSSTVDLTITAAVSKSGYTNSQGTASVRVQVGPSDDWQHLADVNAGGKTLEVWVSGNHASASSSWSSVNLDGFISAVDNIKFVYMGSKVLDGGTIMQGVSAIADKFIARPSMIINARVVFDDNRFTTPQYALSQIESYSQWAGCAQLILQILDLGIISDLVFQDPDRRLDQGADCLVKALHNYRVQGNMVRFITATAIEAAFLARDWKKGDLNLEGEVDLNEVEAEMEKHTLQFIANEIKIALGTEAFLQLLDQLGLTEGDERLALTPGEYCDAEYKKEVGLLNILINVRSVLSEMNSESETIQLFDAAIKKQRDIVTSAQTIVSNRDNMPVFLEMVRQAAAAAGSTLIVDLIKYSAIEALEMVSEVGLKAMQSVVGGTLEWLFGAAPLVSLMESVANFDYSLTQYDQGKLSIVLALKLEEIYEVLRASNVDPMLIRQVHSFAVQLSALGYGYAAEGKGSFLLGLGSGYSDVNKVRGAMITKYREVEAETSWLDVLARYDTSMSSTTLFPVTVPDIQCKSIHRKVLSEVRTRAVAGLTEDWVVDMGVVVKVYTLPGYSRSIMVVDPTMVYLGKEYLVFIRDTKGAFRDTGLNKLEYSISINTVSMTGVYISTDMNSDGIYGDSWIYGYDGSVSTMTVSLKHYKGDGRTTVGSVNVVSEELVSLTGEETLSVECPVDITVTDEAGGLISLPEGGDLTSNVAGAVLVSDGSVKILTLPAWKDMRISVTGRNASSNYSLMLTERVEDRRRSTILDSVPITLGDDYYSFSFVDGSFASSLNTSKTFSLMISCANESGSEVFSISDMQQQAIWTYTYTVTNWETLGESNERSVMLEIDEDNDGVPETSVSLRDGLTGKEVQQIVDNEGGTSPLVIALAIATIGMLVVLAAVLFVRRRRK